jgi:hypothetical protein
MACSNTAASMFCCAEVQRFGSFLRRFGSFLRRW